MNAFLRISVLFVIIFQALVCTSWAAEDPPETKLSELGLTVIPYPQQVELTDVEFHLPPNVAIVLDEGASEADRFAAQFLADTLNNGWGIAARIGKKPGAKAIRLTRTTAPAIVGEQGYRLLTAADGATIEAGGEAGLFYGVQTLAQLIKSEPPGSFVPGIEILDWPDIEERAVHYDTKHHQDKASYVKSFIRELSHYKVNMLVWEWEDKLLYPSHPVIGAPGAFTMEEMQEFTRYARQYHIQLVPLVQGLGHVSFILKWPRFAPLREIPASNWEFCPLKDGTYDLLFDLWEDAIRATPGSEYIHIGSDETYELGEGVECSLKAEEIGKSGLYHLFMDRAADHLQSLGRKVMAWERPMGWEHSDSPIKGGAQPAEGLVLTESYNYETPDFKYVRESKEKGYPVFAYDPNPGIEPLFLPYFYSERGGEKVVGSLEKSHEYLSRVAASGVFDGMIRTSWDDAGLHNQFWMLQFLNAAEYSWSGSKPSLSEFTLSFVDSYYGEAATDVEELFRLLNAGAYYYWDTLERKVWHFGTIGKTRLPDLPRGDALEYDPFWNEEYSDMIERSRYELDQMDRALEIIHTNQHAPINRKYDFELFKSVANLIRHTSLLYLDLSNVEHAITEANRNRFLSHKKAYGALQRAEEIAENILERRRSVFSDLVFTWEETRLPKGLSTKDKQFFHRQDRARHFANRRPDLTYLIYDEQMLDVEGFLTELREYMEWYKNTYLFMR